MAERRMFAKTIIDSDSFLDMSLSAQALYFHLSMRADDEGFVNNARKIQRMIGASNDDVKILTAKSFIIPFDSGIIVIKHWKMHNYIRKDRIVETVYKEERRMIKEKSNGAYTMIPQAPMIKGEITVCQTDVSQVTDKCQHRIGKDRIGKGSKDIDQNKNALDSAIDDFMDFRKKIRSPMTDRAVVLLRTSLNRITQDDSEQIKILNQSIVNGWKGVFPIGGEKARTRPRLDPESEKQKELVRSLYITK